MSKWTPKGGVLIPGIIGQITPKVESLLGLTLGGDRNIYIGPTNYQHIQTHHPGDWAKYGSQIKNILASPDYVGQNPTDHSLEYVKEFKVDGEFVKVAVRLSMQGRYYVRSLYILNSNRVKNFIAKGTLKKT